MTKETKEKEPTDVKTKKVDDIEEYDLSPNEMHKETDSDIETKKVEDIEGDEEELGREFGFAMAPIVRIMKEELDKDKMIRSRVKVEMNQWLEKICRKITRAMNRSEYTMVEVDDFKTAIEPYEMIDDVEQERHRIVTSLEKIKQDCDSLLRDVNRKFVTYPAPTRQTNLPSGESKQE